MIDYDLWIYIFNGNWAVMALITVLYYIIMSSGTYLTHKKMISIWNK